MLVNLKLVPKCPKGHRGEFIVRGNSRCEILISREHNDNVGEFAATLLHELLHLWITILQSHGLSKGIRKEHKYIDGILPYILRKLAKSFS